MTRRQALPAAQHNVRLFFAMILIVVGLSQKFASAREALRVAEERLRDGWIALFDGDTLYGWQSASSANWHVKDGCIVVDAGEPGFLRTTSPFADFCLSLEFWCERDTNSGVFVRSADPPTDPAADCYEVNLAPDSNPFPTGSIVARCRSKDVAAHRSRWRSLVVTARGDEITIHVDDIQTCRYTDANPISRGFIALQYHHGRVRFRNIQLRPLGAVALWDAANDGASTGATSTNLTTHWTTYPAMRGRFESLPTGELHVVDGPGQLESKTAYADFILQLEARTNAKGLNSGVFFRCIPGETMMGYESQIHNGYDHQRDRPTDFGTGGIFRRSAARRVVADDEEWFYKTIVAAGPHLAVWVNGYQVSDWTDGRPEHENPRQGRRQKAGTIILQAHDPTTDLLFRNIRIAEIPAN